MSEAKLFAPLYKLLSGIPMPKLRGEWQKLAREDRSTTGLSTQEFVSVLRPYNAGVADELEHTKQCLWLFKQIDSRGGGSLEWADFVKFIMTLTMETGGLAGDDGAINAEASRRAFQPLGLELAEEFARGVAECVVVSAEGRPSGAACEDGELARLPPLRAWERVWGVWNPHPILPGLSEEMHCSE